MSEALSTEAPDTSTATSSVEELAPVVGTAVTDGSAGAAETRYVEADRFNGLMSAHQRALGELEAERRARAELEARYNNQETPVVADAEALDEVRQLREELRTERLEVAKAKALEKYPAAAPLADLILGGTAAEIESVAAAIAERLSALVPAPTTDTTVTDASTETTAPVVEVTAPVVTAPVVAGGVTAPTTPSANEAVEAALASKDWNAYWAAKANPQTATLS